MASESEDVPPAEDTVVLQGDGVAEVDEPTEVGQASAPDEDWPVAEFYRVEPEMEPADTAPAENATLVVTQSPEAAAPRRGWIPPSVGTRLMLTIAGTVGVLILGAVLLGMRDDPGATATTPTPTSTPETTTEGTTTPRSTDSQIALRAVEGMPLGKARPLLDKDGLRVRVSRVESHRPRGEILRQKPAPATEVPKGDVITLVVSTGGAAPATPATVRVPRVVGLTASDAVTAIREAGLGARVQLISSSRSAGTVLRQFPVAETEASRGGTVVLDVAKPPPTVLRIEVPDVVGTTADAARRALRSAGLTVTVVSVQSREPAGTVVSQSPRAGAELRKGDEVTLKVSTGPTKLDVPDATGLDEASARLELENAGFEVRVIDESTSDPAQDGVVVRQSPLGGSTESEGTVITLTVARLG